MTERITYYQPSSGDKFTVKVMKREKNVCSQLAYSLFEIAARECRQPGLEGEPFKPNFVYEFANGLVFRLFDDGLGEYGHVLEFYVPPEHQHNTANVLARIPRLLRMAGVEAEALHSIKGVLQASSE